MTNNTSKSGVHAHQLIAKTAKGLAEEFYERMCSGSDHFYSQNPDMKPWVKAAWPLFLDESRATLARLLTTQINDDLKETIRDALIKDASLIRGRVGQPQIKSF